MSTREATQHQEAGGGCLLAKSLNKQIQRRISQLESFSGPSREVSVIRCISTPNNSLRQCCSFNLDSDEEVQPQQDPPPAPVIPQFQVFLDNPRDYYSLSPEPEDLESVFTEEPEVSTSQLSSDCDILPLFHGMSALEDEFEVPPQDEMATVDGVAPNSDVRRQVLLQITHFKNILRTYNPDRHSAASLIRNKALWVSEVQEKFDNVVEALVTIETSGDINQRDSDDVTSLLEAMTSMQENFVASYEAKCDTAPAAQPAPQQPAGMFPGLQVPGAMINQASPAHSVATTLSEQALARRAQNLVTVESEDVREKIVELHTEFSKVSNWTTAEDHIIELEMTKVKSWREKMEKLKDKVKMLRVKSLDHDLDMGPYTLSKAALDSAAGELEFTIEQMEHEDKERGLYSLNPGKAANLTYPTFSGADTEDFFKFKKEMENCFRGNRVRKEDQVSVLKKELKGDALKLVPNNVTSIATAWDLLDQIYGDPKRILINRRSKLDAMVPLYKLDKFGGNGGRTAAEAKLMVDWAISMELILEDLFKIAKKSTDMNNSVFSEDMYSKIAKLFSANVIGEANKKSGSYREKLEFLYAFVGEKKTELKPFLAQSSASSSTPSSSVPPGNGSGGKNRFSGYSGGRGHGGGSAASDVGFYPIIGSAGFTSFKKPQRLDSCRICKLLDREGQTQGLYEEHHTDNPIGCPVFAQMDTQTKHSYARKARMCLHCLDGDYIWKSGKHVDCAAISSSV